MHPSTITTTLLTESVQLAARDPRSPSLLLRARTRRTRLAPLARLSGQVALNLQQCASMKSIVGAEETEKVGGGERGRGRRKRKPQSVAELFTKRKNREGKRRRTCDLVNVVLDVVARPGPCLVLVDEALVVLDRLLLALVDAVRPVDVHCCSRRGDALLLGLLGGGGRGRLGAEVRAHEREEVLLLLVVEAFDDVLDALRAGRASALELLEERAARVRGERRTHDVELDEGGRREVDDLEALGLCELELLELVEEGRHGVARLPARRVHAVLEVPQGLQWREGERGEGPS